MKKIKNDYLVETEWLAENLKSPNLRIFDCTALPSPNPNPKERRKYPLKPKSGRYLYEEKHIPNAGFIDLPLDLADKNTNLPLMLPSNEQIAHVIANSGIGNNNLVVLYSLDNPMWSARVWWILKSIGFDNAVILNGGLQKWIEEGRPIEAGYCQYKAEEFITHPRENIFVDKYRVLSAIQKEKTILIHALTPSVYDGSNDKIIFGRPGHIPSSINIPSQSLHNQEFGTYLPISSLKSIFKENKVDKAEQIITYCGAGINASNTAFVLSLLGYENVSVYDGSMNEWGNDPTLPIEI